MVCYLQLPRSGIPVRDWFLAPLREDEVWRQSVKSIEERPGGHPRCKKIGVGNSRLRPYCASGVGGLQSEGTMAWMRPDPSTTPLRVDRGDLKGEGPKDNWAGRQAPPRPR